MRKCTFGECVRKHYAKGLCNTHYYQRQMGRPLTELGPMRPKRLNGSAADRNERGEKQCSTCRQWLSINNFYRMKPAPDGLRHSCKRCASAHNRSGQYGVDVQSMFDGQSGQCAICRTDLKGRWAVDHDHACCAAPNRSCGRCVRGLLCKSCNLMLGMAGDSPELLRGAADYLVQYYNVAVGG